MRNHSLYLVDSSVWIQVIPRGHRLPELEARIETLGAGDQLAITGMVRLEVLAGISNEAEYNRWEERLAGVRVLRTTERDWDEAARLGSQLRRQGVTIPFTDLLIAAVAMDSGATVLHRDRHFDLIARHAPLSVESHVAAGAT